MENGEVFGSVWEAGVVSDIVTDDRRRILYNWWIVTVAVTARSLEWFLRAGAAVEPVTLEVSDCVDDYWQIATRQGRMTAYPTHLVVWWANCHLKLFHNSPAAQTAWILGLDAYRLVKKNMVQSNTLKMWILQLLNQCRITSATEYCAAVYFYYDTVTRFYNAYRISVVVLLLQSD